MQERLTVIKGDITRVAADAIVNAANSSLLGGGGVDGAIHHAGGPAILDGCKQIVAQQGLCNTGDAVITTAGNLPAKYVIHTVGPIWHGGKEGEHEKLANCYRNSLKLAVANDCRTIAFPNISTGVYGFPKKEAAKIGVDVISNFLENNNSIVEVTIVCFDDENYNLVNSCLQ